MRDLIGVWRLVRTLGRTSAGEPMRAPYGPSPMGLAAFTAEKRMTAVLCDGRTTLPVDEREREFSAYCGNYDFDGQTLITAVDAASDIVRLGGNQLRSVRFEGDQLVLCPPPRNWQDAIQYRELFWERLT